MCLLLHATCTVGCHPPAGLYFTSLVVPVYPHAVGAVLEFRGHISEEEAEAALSLPGGGAHDVGPGQVSQQ